MSESLSPVAGGPPFRDPGHGPAPQAAAFLGAEVAGRRWSAFAVRMEQPPGYRPYFEWFVFCQAMILEEMRSTLIASGRMQVSEPALALSRAVDVMGQALREAKLRRRAASGSQSDLAALQELEGMYRDGTVDFEFCQESDDERVEKAGA